MPRAILPKVPTWSKELTYDPVSTTTKKPAVRGLMTATATRRTSSRRRQPEHTYSTLIIGAGFLGLGTAIKLLEAGVEDFVVLERGERVGGTWRDNTYPGAAVDIPSMLYSFSFAKNPSWSRLYAPAQEIRAHIDDLVSRFDLARFIRLRTEVADLRFDESVGVWNVSTSDGATYRAAPSSRPAVRCRTPACPPSAASTATPARRSTARSGTTISTSPASGSPSSAPARARCNWSPNSSRPRRA